MCKCGIVCAPVRIHGTKNCARRTTRPSMPTSPPTKDGSFDHPAKSCRSCARIASARPGDPHCEGQAKDGHWLSPQHAAREAARAERSRQEMGPRSKPRATTSKSNWKSSLHNLSPSMPRSNAFVAWRQTAHGGGRSRIPRCATQRALPAPGQRKGPAVIADAVLSCSSTL